MPEERRASDPGTKRLRQSAILLFCAALSAPGAASAEPAAGDKERVLSLYNQGKELLELGKVEGACHKFEEAKSLDAAAINLLLRLGDCYERLGKSASAWDQYRQAATIARAGGDARAANADERASALEPRLGRLTITLPKSADGIALRRNGSIVPPEQLGSPTPLDPGTYTIEASAPGKRPWTAQRAIVAGEAVELTVPPLEDLKAQEQATPPAVVTEESGMGSRKIVALTLGGAGLLGLGASTSSESGRCRSTTPRSATTIVTRRASATTLAISSGETPRARGPSPP